MTRRRKVIVGVIVGFFVLCCACLGIGALLPDEETEPEAENVPVATNDFTAEPIPTTDDTPPPLNSTATATITTTPKKTAVPATATIRPTRAASSTPRSTNTPRPTNTAVLPTLAPLPTWTLVLPTNTAVFTAVPVVTDTPFPSPVPTQELPTDTPPAPVGPPSGVPDYCTCAGDNLNCPDFGNQPTAQACFNYCVAQGAGDVYGLDNDDDGIACETLPGG